MAKKAKLQEIAQDTVRAPEEEKAQDAIQVPEPPTQDTVPAGVLPEQAETLAGKAIPQTQNIVQVLEEAEPGRAEPAQAESEQTETSTRETVSQTSPMQEDAQQVETQSGDDETEPLPEQVDGFFVEWAWKSKAGDRVLLAWFKYNGIGSLIEHFTVQSNENNEFDDMIAATKKEMKNDGDALKHIPWRTFGEFMSIARNLGGKASIVDVWERPGTELLGKKNRVGLEIYEKRRKAFFNSIVDVWQLDKQTVAYLATEEKEREQRMSAAYAVLGPYVAKSVKCAPHDEKLELYQHWLQNGADDEETIEDTKKSLSLKKKKQAAAASAKVAANQSKRTIDSAGVAREPPIKKARKKAKVKENYVKALKIVGVVTEPFLKFGKPYHYVQLDRPGICVDRFAPLDAKLYALGDWTGVKELSLKDIKPSIKVLLLEQTYNINGEVTDYLARK